MERNSFVRLTAQKIERTDPEFDFKIVIICGLDAGKIIIDGGNAMSSRPSLTLRSSRHLQAWLAGSLRAAHSGAAYLGR